MHRIYVSSKIEDARAKVKQRQFSALGIKSKIGSVCLVDCYTIDSKLDKKQIEKTKTLLANPLTQSASPLPSPLPPQPFSFAIEIGFLPGVTDNIGNTAKETLADGARIKFKPGQNVYSSQVIFISGNISEADVNTITSSLYNPLIQRASITPFLEYKKNGLDNFIPKVKLSGSSKVEKVNLDISNDDLIILGKRGIKNKGVYQGPLALSLAELKAIAEYFKLKKRKPTDIELESLAQTWSEHCKHTIFSDPIDELKDGIFKTYIRAATETIRKNKGKNDFCVSVFTDNAGGISFDEHWIISHKVETHNTPSALDPFGGSITGIVGVNRDALGFGLGSKPVANFYGFCLAEPTDKTKLFRDKELKQPMLSARRIMEGVIAGINAGGNQSGIPTPLGFLYFDPKFRGKPLVFAGTLGLTPKKIGKKNGWEKIAKPGDLIVVVGGRVGADGIHGATFSSEGLDSHSPSAAVQIGDPITQKKLSDAICKEARDLGLYSSITDCGAGGLSSAVGEMAKDSNGCIINLEKVPLKYPGLKPWQIWISESQERMVLSVPKNKWPKFFALMKQRGVEATAIGQFTNSGNCVVKYGSQKVMELDMEFLHNGRPKKELRTDDKRQEKRDKSEALKSFNLQSSIFNLLSSPNITSNEFISTQYDHEVQGSSILKPLQGRGRVNSEAGIFRPVLNSEKAVVTSYGLHPELSEINPYNMAACSIDSAIRAAVAAGANVDYLALLDNFCWCSSDEPQRLWQLKEASRACYDMAVAFGTPFISGKDSMYNDFKGFSEKGDALKISIPPTLLITTVGIIPDAAKAVSLDAKLPGDFIYILGETNKEQAAPAVNAEKNLKLYRNFYKTVQKSLAASSISVNNGGLAAAIAKKLIGGGLGAEINLGNLPGNWKETSDALFSESQGRILVTVDPKKSSDFERIMKENIFGKLGKITAEPVLKITGKDKKLAVDVKIKEAEKSYKQTFKDY